MSVAQEQHNKLAAAAAIVMQRKEVVCDAIDYIKAHSIAQLLATEPKDKEARDDFYLECKALDALKHTLISLAAHANRKVN
ncbi:MAG: hypothetical protein ACC682_02185 [Gemmatimonadota bacterium]